MTDIYQYEELHATTPQELIDRAQKALDAFKAGHRVEWRHFDETPSDQWRAAPVDVLITIAGGRYRMVRIGRKVVPTCWVSFHPNGCVYHASHHQKLAGSGAIKMVPESELLAAKETIEQLRTNQNHQTESTS